MKCLIICDAALPVPPLGYGGIERIADALCRGFSGLGWDVRLLAHPQSRTSGRLFPHLSPSLTYPSRVRRKLQFQPLSLWAAHGVDVAINFGRSDYLWALGRFRSELPSVFIFQNPIQGNEAKIISNAGFKQFKLVSISNQQRAHVQDGDWITVYNAVNTEKLAFSAGTGAYLAYLGRLNASKGVDIAIEVARASGRRLRIGGNIPDEAGAQAFFETHVAPHLGDQIEWVGEVDDDQKVAFLGEAAALLLPLRWDEPFGIVMAEALACGTPVIAFRKGSVCEVVSHGQTGYICDDTVAMIAAVGKLDELDRSLCRKICVERFSESVMVDRYADVLTSMVRHG